MEMRAKEDIEIGQDITPPLPPLAFSLYDSFLLTHCSCCFSPLPTTPFIPSFSINHTHVPTTVYYCSSHCSASDSPLHLSSAEHHLLLQSHSSTSPPSDSSDLRLSLRLLRTLNPNSLSLPCHFRICGLLTNREKFTSRENLVDGDDDILRRIRDGAKAMAVARRMRDGIGEGFDEGGEALALAVEEEAVLCLVLTNAVEVQINGGRALGVAVYDTLFSWINHSCSPNACYRLLASAPTEMKPYFGESTLRIVPGGQGDTEIELKDGIRSNGGLKEGGERYGPRIVVRSIKAIREGEEVSVAYTDLLQPKAIRQSELWLKYRFMCCCSRCRALPPTYLDQALQESLDANPDTNSLSSAQIFYKDEAIRKITDYVDDVITEYLSAGNPEPCSEKLENMLTQGLLHEHSDKEIKSSRSSFRLHPLHHLSLNAYTTLASAYKIRASHLLAVHPERSEHLLRSFQHEQDLCSLFFVACRSSTWNLILQRGSPIADPLSIPSRKCNKCSLLDRFEVNLFCSQSRNAEFEKVSKEFLDCITNITPKVWTFLSHGCRYLTAFIDPFDLSWIDNVNTSEMWDLRILSGGNLASCCFETQGSVSHCEVHGYTIQERANLFQLGFHLLLYGGILSSICYGQCSQ